jgi:chloramphenicol O-acetyltransferase type A
MKTPIDLNTWNRKEHFLLFSKYDNPFWSVSAHVDATQVYQKSKERHLSFAAAYHWAATKAANEVDALRMRIENDLPVLYDRIHVSTTIARPDGTFGFSFTKYESDFEKFHKDFIIETKRVQSETGLKSPYTDVDVIYCTVLKNIRFTSMEHAHNLGDGGVIPFFAFGKFFEEGGKLLLPTSLRIHHALVDGQHVGQFYKRFEEILHEF